MPTYLFPSSAQITQIEQELLPRLTNDDPIFEFFPIVSSDSALVEWWVEDNYFGLMAGRGYNGEPTNVPDVGANHYVMSPSVFGEFGVIDEYTITTRAAPGRPDIPIPVQDLVARRLRQLLTRQVNRISWMAWTLLVNGQYVIIDKRGTVIGREAYKPKTYNPSVLWSSTTTAVPLQDFHAIQNLEEGQSASFGSDAVSFMNRRTFNYLSSNTNAADLGGKRSSGLASVTGLDEINRILLADDLPQIQIWNQGYIQETASGPGTWTPWIPTGQVVTVGNRGNNRRIGSFSYTRNASNPDTGARPYVKVVDVGARDNEPPPRSIQVHRGFNGGLTIEYPGAVVVSKVA